MKRIFTLLIALSFGSMAMGQIATFPYMEDFEAEATCGTGCGAACVLSGDFTNDLVDDLDWLADVGGTGSGGTGPSVDHTLGTSAGKYLFVETSCSGTGYPNFTANLESPWFDFVGQSNMVLSFWYHAFGATTGNLNVEARIGMNGPWANITGPITDNVDVWQEWSGCLGSAYSNIDSVQIRFNYVTGTSFTGDIGLDDVSIALVDAAEVGVTLVTGPSGCGLGANEVLVIEVCNFGDTLTPGTQIPVSFSVDGGTPVSETITLAAGLSSVCNGGGCVSYTFTGAADLSGPGAHTLMAWSSLAGDVIAANDTAWGAANNVGIAAGLPYYQNFEGGRGSWVEDNTNSGTWAFGTPAKNVITGAASGDSAFTTGGLGIGTYSAGENSDVTSGCIDISTATGAEVFVMKTWWNSEFSWDGANVSASNDGGVTWSLLGAFGDPDNWYNDNSINSSPSGSQNGWTGRASTNNGSGGWVCSQHKLDSAMLVNNSSVMLRVGFGSDGSVNDDGFAFDDAAIGMPITYDYAMDSVIGVCGDTMFALDAGAGYEWYSVTGPGYMANGQNHVITATGIYTITVSDSLGMCAKDDVYIEIRNFIDPDLEDMMVCVGDSAMWDAQGGVNATYMWTNGDSTQTTWLFVDGMIGVTKIDTVNGCMAMDSAMLMYNMPVSLMDMNVCMGDTGMFDATTANSTYMWSTGDSTAMIWSTTTGTYYVDVMDTVLGCMSSDTLVFGFWAAPAVDLGADVTECDDADLDAGAWASYSWSTAETTQMINVTASGSYVVAVSDSNGCMNMDTVDVTINVGPTVNLGADFIMCVNHEVSLDAGTGVSYLWSNAETTQMISLDGSVLGAGTFVYSVDVTDANTCVGSDDVEVTVDECIGVAEVEAGISVNLFPNPANNQLNIAIEDANASAMMITLLNVQGQTVLANQFNGGTEYTVNMDVSNLAPGVYFVKFENNAQVMTRRVVIR
jgi:hypothetical protein